MRRNKPRDPRGRHIRVYVDLLNCPAYRALSFTSKALFFDLRSKITATNNGNISATLSDLKHHGWNSSATLSKSLYELRALGFIDVTVQGGLKQGKRRPSLYRFTDLEVFEQPKLGIQPLPDTRDYSRINSVSEAKFLLKTRCAELKELGKKRQQSNKKLPVLRLNHTNSDYERQSLNSDS